MNVYLTRGFVEVVVCVWRNRIFFLEIILRFFFLILKMFFFFSFFFHLPVSFVLFCYICGWSVACVCVYYMKKRNSFCTSPPPSFISGVFFSIRSCICLCTLVCLCIYVFHIFQGILKKSIV